MLAAKVRHRGSGGLLGVEQKCQFGRGISAQAAAESSAKPLCPIRCTECPRSIEPPDDAVLAFTYAGDTRKLQQKFLRHLPSFQHPDAAIRLLSDDTITGGSNFIGEYCDVCDGPPGRERVGLRRRVARSPSRIPTGRVVNAVAGTNVARMCF